MDTAEVYSHDIRSNSMLVGILSDAGSSAAFAIYVQEMANGGPEGVPCMRVASGRAAAVDVRCAFDIHEFTRIGMDGASSKDNNGRTAAQTQVAAARQLLNRYLLRPQAAATPSSKESSSRSRYPPLHVSVTPDELQLLQSQIDKAERSLKWASSNGVAAPAAAAAGAGVLVAGAPLASSLPLPLPLPLPPTIFTFLFDRVVSYLSDSIWPDFLSSLSFDHREVLASLLGPEDVREQFMRVAHSCYLEEYALCAMALETIRAEIEEGPPGMEGASSSSSSSSSAGSPLPVPSSLSPSPPPVSVRIWTDHVLRALDQFQRIFLRPRAEYSIFLDADIRSQVDLALKVARRTWRIEAPLLQALQIIKDFAMEVLTLEVLPQFQAEKRGGGAHVRRRRASLMEPEEIAAAAAADANEALAAAAAPSSPSHASGIIGRASMGAADGSSSHASSSSPDPHSPIRRRRSSLVGAAVDVPLGARRGSHSHLTPKVAPAGSASPAMDAAATTVVATGDSSTASSSSSGGGAADQEEDNSSGPAAPSNPNLRSMRELRHRRASSASHFTVPVPSPRAAEAPAIRVAARRTESMAQPTEISRSPSPHIVKPAVVKAVLASPAIVTPPVSPPPMPSTPSVAVAVTVTTPPPNLSTPTVVVVSAAELGLTNLPPPPPPDTDDEEEEGEGDEHTDTVTQEAVPPQHTRRLSPMMSYEAFAKSAEALLGQTTPTAVAVTPTNEGSAHLLAVPAAQSAPSFSFRRRSVVGAPEIFDATALGASTAGESTRSAVAPSSPRAVAPVSPALNVHFPRPPFVVSGFVTARPLPPPIMSPNALRSGGHSPDLSKRPTKSILKTKLRSETIQEMLRRVYAERVYASALCLPYLQAGCLMHKYSAAGVGEQRFVQVSSDASDLCWGRVDSQGKSMRSGLFNRKRHWPLADIVRMRFGSLVGLGNAAAGSGGGDGGDGGGGGFTSHARLAKFNAHALNKPWLAFSIDFADKHVDLVARTEADAMRWFTGVQSLAPLNTSYLSHAGLLWRRAQLKLYYYSHHSCTAPMAFLDDLLQAARQDVPLGRLPDEPYVQQLDMQLVATVAAITKKKFGS